MLTAHLRELGLHGPRSTPGVITHHPTATSGARSRCFSFFRGARTHYARSCYHAEIVSSVFQTLSQGFGFFFPPALIFFSLSYLRTSRACTALRVFS